MFADLVHQLRRPPKEGRGSGGGGAGAAADEVIMADGWRYRPIVILTGPELPPERHWDSIADFDDLHLVLGEPHRREDLRRAGVVAKSGGRSGDWSRELPHE